MIHDVIYYGSLGLSCIFATLYCIRQYIVWRREGQDSRKRGYLRLERRYETLRPLSNSRRHR